MKRIPLSMLLISLALFAFAQRPSDKKPAYKMVQKDTINLRGYVYQYDGRPATGILLRSRQLDLKYNLYNIAARTDSTGYFELKGALPNDTLTYSTIDRRLTYMNNGSRYMVIYLPPEKAFALNADTPIEVKARRTHPIVKPTFKIIPFDLTRGASWEYMPEPVGGINRFFVYIKQHLIYPEKAITNNIEGTVEASFEIQVDGTLTGVKILKGIGYGCDEELMAVLNRAPKWKPGMFDSRHIIWHATVTVQFKLTD